MMLSRSETVVLSVGALEANKPYYITQAFAAAAAAGYSHQGKAQTAHTPPSACQYYFESICTLYPMPVYNGQSLL